MFRTDKVGHGFLPTYLALAAELGAGARVCEIGVAGGDSLDMWQTLFPDGLVVGVDNGTLGPAKWPDGTVEVRCDMTSPDLPNAVQTAVARARGALSRSVLFDLVVEDGPHNGDASQRALVSMWPLVRDGGVYVIEDWYVGWDSWPGYDRSMVDLAEQMLSALEHPARASLPDSYRHSRPAWVPDDIESITYRYGQIIIRKAR